MPMQIDGFAGATDQDRAPSRRRVLKHSPGWASRWWRCCSTAAHRVSWAATRRRSSKAWYPARRREAGRCAVWGLQPGGRLPVTFYRSVDDRLFEDYTMEGRTYRYFRGEPLDAFGHGLS